MNRIIVTGGAGFIGSAVVRELIRNTQDEVCVIDKLTCAGNPSKINREFGWKPQETFESGIRKTAEWYLAHKNDWCAHVSDGTYRQGSFFQKRQRKD